MKQDANSPPKDPEPTLTGPAHLSVLRRVLGRVRRSRFVRTERKPPFAPSPTFLEQAIAWLCRFRILRPLMEGVMPTPRLLQGETVQLEIRMAPYRVQAIQWFFTFSLILLMISLPIAILATILRAPSIFQLTLWLLTLLAFLGLVRGVRGLLLYYQWRFILTNKRIIIIAPDAKRRGFADVIYLKGGKIQVVDTSWSKSAIWGLFQAMTGARDVVISLTGYEFKPEGAEVKGGLLFPDVMPEDIIRLEELIFG